MALATRLKWFLDTHEIPYEVLHHAHTSTSRESARVAHIPSGRMAKCVLLEDERGYVMAVIPASCRLQFEAIERELGRTLEIASEPELGRIFPTCEVGAVPAAGAAFNVPTLIDESLLRLPDVYFEGGSHEDLVHVSHEAFEAMLEGAAHGRFSRPD